MIGIIGIGSDPSGSVIERCFATGDVSVGGNAGQNLGNAGGLIGEINSSTDGVTVRNCYALGDVSSDANDSNGGAGGIIGRTDEEPEENATATIEGVYAANQVIDHVNTGGLVGTGESESSLENSYWDTTKGPDDADGTGDIDTTTVEGLETNEMQGDTPAPAGEDTMNGLDFEDTWDTVSDDYPVLQALDRDTQLDARE